MRSLTDTVGELVRREIRQAQEELTGKARQAGVGLGLLAGAAVLGAMAAGAAGTAVVRLFDRLVSPRFGATLATAGFGAGAAWLAGRGLKEIRSVGSIVPEHTIAGIRDDVETVSQKH